MKAILTLLIIAALIVGATWFITKELRRTVAAHEQRLGQLEQRPRFVSRSLSVDGIATTANTNRSIWTVEGTEAILFAQLYVETFGTQLVNKSVALSASSGARKSVVIERGTTTGGVPGNCTLTFWLEKNQIMLAPATCTSGIADDHASIEAAAEVK